MAFAFFIAWTLNMSVLAVCTTNENPNSQYRRHLPILKFIQVLLIGKCFFLELGNV